jgi:formiminotetrahydrofolate cyclodeaminase
MKLYDMTLHEFVEAIDSKSPAPGGGSVSALCATMGVALSRMVGHLTVDKKKFLALPKDIQFEFMDVNQALIIIKDELKTLIDEDTNAFNMIMQAYQMPKDSSEHMMLRNQAIQRGTAEAIRIPIKVATLSLSALHQLPMMLEYGNKTAISDLGVSVLMLSAAIEGACMNVLINLPGFDDQIAKHQYEHQVKDLMEMMHTSKQKLLAQVYQHLEK